MYMGETPKGLTGPDMEAAQQLVHLSSDEDECNSHSRREAKAKAAVQSGREEGKATTEGMRAEGDADDGDEGEDDDKGACPRKRRFRSIAYIYKVTRPVRLYDQPKRRKNH